MKKIIRTENAPKPAGPYSQGIIVDKFLFVSGQVAIDPKEGKIVANDIKGQTIRVMENIKAILQAARYSFSHVVQSNVYLSSMKLFSEFNSEYAKYFDKEFPTRITVGTELIPGALVEISVIAYKE
jgi:2-iminobutanoate/2-iminopropanoate deaminase